ncbi:MAG: DUF2357 domain-containing protein [Candidatus Electrothrix sp. EH2]|nr:DUF2357 domain-containing protein [Candidatus Electrothrix sp. EH2]
MLKIFSVYNKTKKEVKHINNIFNVVESFDYYIEYYGVVSDTSIFIEDFPIERDKYQISEDSIKTECGKFFQDYFGFAILQINKKKFTLNIQVEKIKIEEIDEMFKFLWKKEEKIFNNFLSKSSVKIKFDKNNKKLHRSSKTLLFIEYFIESFSTLFSFFQKQPHFILREGTIQKNYSGADITQQSLAWLVGNLDLLNFFDKKYAHPDSFQINGRYAAVDKIQSSEKKETFDTYENRVILGAFVIVLKKIKSLKKEIQSNINIRQSSNSDYAEFQNLKSIPFIKLYDESKCLERKCKLLFAKYQKFFFNVSPLLNRPENTPVFYSVPHYRKAFSIIMDLFQFKFEIGGQLRLLNIRKLSQLYEIYNFHIIGDIVKKMLRADQFEIYSKSTREDELLNHICFYNKEYRVNIYYEKKYPDDSGETELVRIDCKKGNYYVPDHIIEIVKVKSKEKNYYLLDSKYSKQSTVRNYYTNKCVFKYILNTGIRDKSFDKTESLALLFPSGSTQHYLESTFYKPTVDLVVVAPSKLDDFSLYIENIIKSALPAVYLS